MEKEVIYSHRMAIIPGHRVHAVFILSDEYIQKAREYFAYKPMGFTDPGFIHIMHHGLFNGEPHLLPSSNFRIDIYQGYSIKNDSYGSSLIVDIPIIENCFNKRPDADDEVIRRTAETLIMNIANSIGFKGVVEITIIRNDIASSVQFFHNVSEFKIEEDCNGIG